MNARPDHPDAKLFPACPYTHARIRKAVGDRCCPHDVPEGQFRVVTLAACLACPLAGVVGPLPPRPPYVGDVLAELLAKEYGARVTAQCNCADRIAEMNAWGPDGCDREIETICGWIIDSAASVAGVHNAVPEWAKRTALRPLVLEAIRTVREWVPPSDASADLAAAA